MLESPEKIIMTTCASHCGGTCVLKVHIKEGIIIRIETDDGEEPQLRACLKGRAYRQRVYAPDRLIYPMKRVGNRGEGEFKRITWEEVFDTVARELIRVRDTYGPESILFLFHPGDMPQIHTPKQIHKLLCRAGGCTVPWGVASYQGGVYASLVTYGTWRTSHSRDDLPNSRLIIMWAWNPASTVTGTNTCWYLAQAKEAGAKIIAVDPQYTNTAATFASQWIPILPGTDAAMLIAMAYVMIKEGIYDQNFLDTFTIGFDRYKDYVLGIEDGIPKTPAWAEPITGVPASTIEALAMEYATTKPAALMAGPSPGRTAYGEQYHRAAMVLAAMTGNVGIHGGGGGGRTWESSTWYPYRMKFGLVLDDPNPVEQVAVKGGIPSIYVRTAVHYVDLPEFILKGKTGGFPRDCKLIYLVNCNYVNQFPNTNKITKALQKPEFIVVHEQFMTPTAKFADIILPITTFLERNDIDLGVGTPFYGFVRKAIEPVGECKSPLEIARELASRMGIADFEDVTEEKLLREEVKGSEILDYDEFQKKGIYRIKLEKPYVAFKKEIEDPTTHPFSTPSGKIEIYSQQWAELSDEKLPPIPKYIETWESRNDPLAKKYPLQLLSFHLNRRTHTQFDNIPWLRELEPQAIMINSVDAEVRGINDGEMVKVFNDRGVVIIPAKVTERIMPGVVSIPQGAWYNPDENGVDRGGCANVLTKDQKSPGGAFPYNTCLVQVIKI